MFLSPLVSPSQQQETLPATQNRELSSLVKRVLRQTHVTINIRVALSTLCIHVCICPWGTVLQSHKGRHPKETVIQHFFSKLEISGRQT
jgi:hypothetical protein